MARRRPSKARDRQAREVQERSRLHAARRAWHDGLIRRRTRDNIIASIAGGLIVVGAFVSQAAFAQVAPPAPAPSPSPSVTTPAETPSTTPETPAPETTP